MPDLDSAIECFKKAVGISYEAFTVKETPVTPIQININNVNTMKQEQNEAFVETNVSAKQEAPARTTTQTRVVACPCCGANNTVSGNLGECDYCGSPLK